MTSGIDLLGINIIRTLSIDAVQKVSSGHPGTPMAMARALVRPEVEPTETTVNR